MDDKGAFIAALLDSSRKAYAAGTVLRMQEDPGGGSQLVENLGFSDLVQDTEVRLQHLAEALACGREELFALDVDWLAATYAARELPVDHLQLLLECMRQELEDSLPDDAGPVAARFITQAQSRLPQAMTPPPSPIPSDGPHAETCQRFLLGLLEGDRVRAEAVLSDALDAGASIPELHTEVIQRAQAELGRMWQIGEIHIAEEHLGSRIVEDVLAYLRTRIVRAESNGRSVLIAAVAGNLHDIGARMVADHFDLDGWRTYFLGADMPGPDLAQAAKDFSPDIVALSVGLGLNMRTSADSIAAIRRVSPETGVIVGGAPFSSIPDLWSSVGADACATDAASAVVEARRLVGA